MNSSYKVAHLTSAHPRDDIRIYHKQCLSLAKAGYSVALVVGDGLGFTSGQGVQVYDVGANRGRLDRVLNAPGRVLKKAVELDAHIYHLHDPELLWVGLWLRLKGKRVIFDSHEDVPLQLLSKPYLKPSLLRMIASLYGVMERHFCRQFSGVIAATPIIRDKFLAIQPKTVDICNFPMLEEFLPSAQWSEKRDEVCYVGGISPVRGLREMVLAMADLKGRTRLNLVGGFSDPLDRQNILSEPGWARVNEIGICDRAGVAQTYARSFAGLVTLRPIPNYVEALPIKMFEYMAAGIPVIASAFPMWRDIVEKYQCGICVDPMDPQAIARAIEHLAAHPELARAMGENGRLAAMTVYNWRAEEAKLLDFYRELLSGSSSSHLAS